MEALTFILKQEALKIATRSPGLYSFAELAMLREESYAIGTKGEAYSSPKFTPMPETFRFTINMMMKGTLPGFAIHVGVPGWEALKKATAIRNRLAHPKAAPEMTVTDGELRCVQDAFFWVNDSTVKALAQAVEVLHHETGEPVPPELERIKQRWRTMAQQREHSRNER
jgi:hypothetical protein